MLPAISLLYHAVSIASVSGHEKAVADYLVSWAAPFAHDAFVDASGSAIATFGPQEAGVPHVIFLGHIDTVPGDIPVKMHQGKLYGRGSVDAKGSTCTALAAAAEYYQEPRQLRLTVIGATEEEAPTSKGARHAVKHYGPPEAVIIGEPSNWDAITLGYKGRLICKMCLEKDNFHSAGDDSTASEDMVGCWQVLQAWQQTLNVDAKGVFDAVQMSLQEIRSESDGLKQRCYATVGFRLPPDCPPNEVEQFVKERFAAEENLTLSFTGHEQPYKGPKNTVLARAFRTAIRQQGAAPRLKLKTGTSDMNVVAPHWPVPMIAYGPGDSKLDHTPHEHLELAEYEQAIAVFTRALGVLEKALAPNA